MSQEEFFFRQLNDPTSVDAPPAGAADGASIAALSGRTKTDIGTLDFLQRTALDVN